MSSIRALSVDERVLTSGLTAQLNRLRKSNLNGKDEILIRSLKEDKIIGTRGERKEWEPSLRTNRRQPVALIAPHGGGWHLRWRLGREAKDKVNFPKGNITQTLGACSTYLKGTQLHVLAYSQTKTLHCSIMLSTLRRVHLAQGVP